VPAQIIRFADFELDLGRYQLRRNDRGVKLEKNPMELLILLVEKQGELVTREEIIRRLWGDNVFVDTRHGINTAVHKLRSALRDDSDRPRILETVVGKGYRLVAGIAATSAKDHLFETAECGSWAGRPNGQNAVVQVLDTGSNGSSGDEATAPRWRLAVQRWVPLGIALAAGVALAFWLVPRDLRDRPFGSQFTNASIQSLAVLPFENLSGDSSKDYFADGFTDELITDLAEQTKIRVVSRSSVVRYKASRKPLPEIAQELKVDAIVEGSVSLSDQQVRITAQLIQARSDRHLWAHSYERDRKDLFSIQREVATTIASLIRVEADSMNSTNVHSAFARQRFTAATYELSLECLRLRMTATEEGVSQAIQCYQHILTLDPNCAAAYAELADAYLALDLDRVPKSRAAAMKALDLDPSLPEAHVALADFKAVYEKDLAGAEMEFNQALALNPSYERALVDHAPVLVATGRTADAIAEVKSVRELDPFSARDAVVSGMVLFLAGQYDKAIDEEKAALQLDSQRERAHYWLGYAYEQKGMYKAAIAENEKRLPVDDHGIFLVALGRSLWLQGDFKKAAEVRRKIEHFSGKEFVWPYDAALFYAALGDNDHAFDWLNRDLKQRDGWLVFLNVDPRLSSLRSDPRFHDLVQRVGLPVSVAK
jgi:TolB-like protein/DNA-binding winged helix-turn-helix (wHTH) protein/Tfp pilus assembly protein PilF